MTAKVLREVAPELRESRGRWWRPNGAGYTDNIAEAGLYDAGTYRGERDAEVEAEPVLAAELAKLGRLTEMLEATGGEPRMTGHMDQIRRALRLPEGTTADEVAAAVEQMVERGAA